AMAAKMGGMRSSLPGQLASLWGQASQVAACGAHSAGMRKPCSAGVRAESVVGMSVAHAAGEVLIGVHAAVAQEGPVLAHGLDFVEVAGGHHDLFLFRAGAGQDAAAGVGDEAVTPE